MIVSYKILYFKNGEYARFGSHLTLKSGLAWQGGTNDCVDKVLKDIQEIIRLF